MKNFIIAIFLILFTGCPNVPLEDQIKEQEKARNAFVLELLPPNSSIVKRLSSDHMSGWYIVDIKIDEKTTKRCLLRWWYGSHMEEAISLIELNSNEV